MGVGLSASEISFADVKSIEEVAVDCESRLDNSDQLAELLVAVRGGCETSFGKIYLLASPLLFGIILRIARDRADAEEVLQEVFVKVWQRSAQFDGRNGFAVSWLTAIARNSAIDHLRQRNARPRVAYNGDGGEDEPYEGLYSEDLQPQELVIRARFTDAVEQCLNTLSAGQRESMQLAFHEGLTYSEIAQRVGKPIGTVKSFIRRALVIMRSALVSHR